MSANDFALKVRAREQLVGYWITLDSPAAAERIGRLGYDYVVLDGQHGLIGYRGLVTGLLAIDAGSSIGPRASVGLVRVEANDPTPIGRALDAGATGVIVPLVDTADDVARAVRAAKYPPAGARSFGPMRAALRIGPVPADSNEATVVLAMIETPLGLRNVAEICATPGLDGVYVGPSDLSLALGAKFPGDPEVDGPFEEAVELIARTAREAGVAAGIHTFDGEAAKRRLAQGYTFATVASDLSHLEAAAAAHLTTARS
ncbi:4-hydroxy-2-oxoheptanedioate aldolase [Kribbella aluminosa]|uniref:4-hydroxy-2-oxoheptanedioate aldolase n=1 Tax=Kribbella aluminosa TaxID=416017 RepID=A0ABS4UUH0_9ACTN|nr:aldolase/citrate lyase family protein [Kribbella aluminosa]MBP2355285.1 4-hydroxy-2-oxoheptanedioate aldolase [Kribbella aluminosa]